MSVPAGAAQFMAMLDSMTVSRSRIEAAGAHCIASPTNWDFNLRAIMSLITKENATLEQRLPYLYVLNVTLKDAAKRNQPQFSHAVAKYLPTLLEVFAPSGMHSSIKEVRKVFDWWSKNIFDEATMFAAQQKSKSAAKANQPVSSVNAPPGSFAVKATYDFAATDARYLALKVGEIYTVVKQTDANWYTGTDSNGNRGIFPINRVQRLVTEDRSQSVTKRKRMDDLSKRPLKFAYTPKLATIGELSVDLYDPSLPSKDNGGVPREIYPYEIRKTFIKSQNAFVYENVITKEVLPMAPTDFKQPSVVHILDLDETLIQFNHLVTGAYASRTRKDPEHGKVIGSAFEELIFEIAERHFHFLDLENCNQCCIQDVNVADDNKDLSQYNWADDEFDWPATSTPDGSSNLWTKLAYRCRDMASRYAQLREALSNQDNISSIREEVEEDDTIIVFKTKYALTPEKKTANGLSFESGVVVKVLDDKANKDWWRCRIGTEEGWVPVNHLEKLEETDEEAPELSRFMSCGILTKLQLRALNRLHKDLSEYTDKWLEVAIRFLHSLQRVAGAELILVTNSELSPAFVKLALFRLAPFFKPENVYSSSKCGKKLAFTKIRERFGDAPVYCGFGDGPEEESLCRELQYPFWKVGSIQDLKDICRQSEFRNGHLPHGFISVQSDFNKQQYSVMPPPPQHTLR